jgi:tetratricopeptide (TPR) repeat protein
MIIAGDFIVKDYIEENELAEEHIINGRLPEAAGVLVNIIDRSSENSRAFNNLGVIAWKQQNWYDAFGLFKHALELAPSYADAASNLFDLALKTHRIDEVRDILIKASELLPDDEELEDIALGLREDGDEIYYCGRAMQQGYFHPDIALADALVIEGELDKATLLYLKVMDEQGELAEVYNGLAVINYHRGNYDDAFQLFLETIKQNPINRDFFLNFFDCSKIVGKESIAAQVFYRCKEQYPQLEELEGALPTV